MHGNPNIHFSQLIQDSNRVRVLALEFGETVWDSYPLSSGTASVCADSWSGTFVNQCEGGCLLPAGEYEAILEDEARQVRERIPFQVEPRELFTGEFTGQRANWFRKNTEWHSDGDWLAGPEGIAPKEETAFLFADGHMHGTIDGTFSWRDVPVEGQSWGLIARHYNAFMHPRVIFSLEEKNLHVKLVQLFNQAPDRQSYTVLKEVSLPWAGQTIFQVQWRMNGRRHDIYLNGRHILHGRLDFMGGVTVVGLFAEPGTVFWQRFAMTTSVHTAVFHIQHPEYEAAIRPGNIHQFKFRKSAFPDQNIFWESGIQFGHIGASEIKFTQSARLDRIVTGSALTQIRWEGPMPKFVDQADDVRGRAHGLASFFQDRIVLADYVLPWVRRSVGPDFDLLARKMTGRARIALGGQREFQDWTLPQSGVANALKVETCGKAYPVAAAFPFDLGGQTWWLKAVVGNLLHVANDAPASMFAWRCPHGLTASHDFRIAPCTPGIEYGFSLLVTWQQSNNPAEVEADLLELRDDWYCPMNVETLVGTAVNYSRDKENPAEAIGFDGCYDRGTGMYVVTADNGKVELRLDPGQIRRRSVAFCFRNFPSHAVLRCTMNDKILEPQIDYEDQALTSSSQFLLLKQSIGSPVVFSAWAEEKAVLDIHDDKKQPPRSDGCALHVDFENYLDNTVGFWNAGIRSVGDPFTNLKQKEVTVINDPQRAFQGSRCGYIFTDQPDQIGRITLQRRFDAPQVAGDEITEFVFRVTDSQPVDLEHFTVWSGRTMDGCKVGLTLYAGGKAQSGTYFLDIEDALGRHDRVAAGLKQSQWLRVILHRQARQGSVDVWIGPPEAEKYIGRYRDLNPMGETQKAQIGDLSDTQDVGSGYWDDIRVGKKINEGQSVCPPETFRDFRKETPVIPSPLIVGREKQLFVDDMAIQSMTGLKRILHPIQKHPDNPIVVPDQPWETQAKCILPMTILRDPVTGKFRLWYSAWGKQLGKPTYECYAESQDGLHWIKPDLGLVDFNGSKHNNIIREGRMFRVHHTPDDPDPSRRYKAIIRDSGFLVGYSSDGFSWRTEGGVLDQAYDASSVHWDPAEKKWIASCKIWLNGKRTRGYAESKDFVHWSDTYLILAADDRDGPADHLYGMSIFRYESIYVGLLKVYHTDTDRCEVQLAFSRDAKHWVRPDRTNFIPNPSDPAAWDYGNIDDAGPPIDMGHELWFYYAGRSTLHNQHPNDGAMGLGTLRTDGFISLDAGPAEGTLTTPPLVFQGKTLYLNADAQGGRIAVEILEKTSWDTRTDEADLPIHPFLKSNCVPLTADNLAYPVKWTHDRDLGALNAQPVRLRFHLQNAKLYSFWTQ